MVQIKHFTAPQKMPNFQFSRRAKWPWRDKILGAPQRGQKIIVNQSKPILVIVSIKPFTCHSLRQNYFSRDFYWDSLLKFQDKTCPTNLSKISVSIFIVLTLCQFFQNNALYTYLHDYYVLLWIYRTFECKTLTILTLKYTSHAVSSSDIFRFL